MVYVFELPHTVAEVVAPALAVAGLIVRVNVVIADPQPALVTLMVSVMTPPVALSTGPKT